MGQNDLIGDSPQSDHFDPNKPVPSGPSGSISTVVSEEGVRRAGTTDEN